MGYDGTSRRDMIRAAIALGGAVSSSSVFSKSVSPDLDKVIASQHDSTVKLIQDWIANPSIAAEDLNYPGGAEYMGKLARDAGFQHVEIIPTKGKPGVFATLDAGAPKTLGIYFMYDVKQFVASEWTSPPLAGALVDRPGLGKMMIGRGVANQKGPELTFLSVLHAFKKAGIKPPVNLVLIAEGEEEIASPNMAELVQTPHVLDALKKSVGVLVPAASQGADGTVTLALGAKGSMEFEMVVDGAKWGRGPSHDIHSSEKARVDSPAWNLVQALATLVSPDGNTVLIDGIPEMVVPLTPRQKQLIAQTARETGEAAVKAMLGVTRWIDDANWEQSLVRLAQEPTVNIQGLIAGYQGPGGKTILPHRAVAKLEMRMVPNMSKDDTYSKLRAHLDKRGFQGVEVNITGGYGPTQTDEDALIIKAARSVYERANAKTVLVPRLPGSWPGVMFTDEPISVPVVSFGLGHGGAFHAPDEFLLIDSENAKVAGLDDSVRGYVDFLYQIAALS